MSKLLQAGLAHSVWLAIFLLGIKGFAQDFSRRPIVGEPFEYSFANVINYPKPTAKVSDFKGKLLILDFWNTACGSCIASWPKLLELQEKYDRQIQIVLVNSYQNEMTVRRVLTEQREREGVEMTLPMVCGDAGLENIFSYRGVPKVVWIDHEGRFKSFTNGTYLNDYFISAILKKKPLSMHQLPIRKGSPDDNLNYENSGLRNYWEAFFVNANGLASEYMPLVSQSVLTGKIDGLMPLWSLVRDDSVRHRTTVTFHGPISTFYEIAYNDINFQESNRRFDLERTYPNRQEWRAKDVRFLPFLPSGEVNYDFFYAYQLTVPSATPRPTIQRIIQLDLAKYFGLDARLEKRLKSCWVISVLDSALLKEKSCVQYPRESGIRPYTMRSFVRHLEYNVFRFGHPVVDETGIKGPISGFRIVEDPVLLAKELRACGLSFTLEEREFDVLVVTEPDGYVFPTHLGYAPLTKVEWTH